MLHASNLRHFELPPYPPPPQSKICSAVPTNLAASGGKAVIVRPVTQARGLAPMFELIHGEIIVSVVV